MEWISVKDRLPEDKQTIIVSNNNEIKCARYFFASKHSLTRIENGIYSSSIIEDPAIFVELDNDCVEKVLDDVTHWMKLPEPPK